MRGFAGLLLAAVSAYPQAAPPSLTATKTRDTYAIGPAGGITLRLEERGTFSRNSAGDEATHLKVIRDDQATSESSVISLRKEGRSYVIDDARQQYRVVPWAESPAVTNEAERKSTPAATRTIDGVKCVAVPVRDGTGKVISKNWVSPDYGITVRSEMDVLNPQTGAAIGLVVEETHGDPYRSVTRSGRVHHSAWIQASGRQPSSLRFADAWLGSQSEPPQKGIQCRSVPKILILDEWFEEVVKPRLKGESYEIRFADDAILCFHHKEDAEKVLRVVCGSRKFDL